MSKETAGQRELFRHRRTERQLGKETIEEREREILRQRQTVTEGDGKTGRKVNTFGRCDTTVTDR